MASLPGARAPTWSSWEHPLPDQPVLDVRNLEMIWYRQRWFRTPVVAVRALAGVSFRLDAGRTLAVIGASGSGKSTLARCLAQMETPTAGEIFFEGAPLSAAHRARVQLIVQQPAASLNPRFTAAEIV